MILYAHYVWIPTTGWMAIALGTYGRVLKMRYCHFHGKNYIPMTGVATVCRDWVKRPERACRSIWRVICADTTNQY